jgi:hypothetical protein
MRRREKSAFLRQQIPNYLQNTNLRAKGIYQSLNRINPPDMRPSYEVLSF